MYPLRFAAGLLCCAVVLARAGAPAPAAPSPVKIEIVTRAGDIVVLLDPARAPKTVANFMGFVDKHFYDGGTFFRAVPGFVIQGGNKARERPGDPRVALEPPMSTGLRNTDGAISMARTSDPDSASSEFFICDGQQPFLDGSMTQPGYAAFGRVISGMDVVRKIVQMPTEGDQLVEPVKILKIVRTR
jgi:peptidyl-prolyl cis-trans isomerase A (cyclophilin A)